MDPPNRRQEASALSETSYLADVIILTARKVSTPIILVAATIARADHTIIVIGQCSYQHAPVLAARCYNLLQVQGVTQLSVRHKQITDGR